MNDPLDRDVVIGVICNQCMLDHKMERRMPTLCRNCRTVKMIQAIPSARPQGEWIYVTVEEWLRTGRDYGHHCSECDEINKSGESNFCPNCGADMRGREDE